MTWLAWPARQLTGTPWIYHAYVGRMKPERTCGHEHRKAATATRCVERLARRLNREESGR